MAYANWKEYNLQSRAIITTANIWEVNNIRRLYKIVLNLETNMDYSPM